MIRFVLLSCVLLCGFAPASAADYWPTDQARTFVFGEPADGARVVIEPVTGDLVRFVVFGGSCRVSWNATVAEDGLMTATDGRVDCEGEAPLEIVFADGGEDLFRPAAVGSGDSYAVQGSIGDEAGSLWVRIDAPRSITVPDGTYEASRFRVALDPFLIATVLSIDVSLASGPVRVEDLGRREVLDGVVENGSASSWSAVKALFE